MFEKPQAEHEWLTALVGEWTSETECRTGPDSPMETSRSTATVRSLNGMWIIMEATADTGQDSWSMIMTLGYDPKQTKYVGTFVGSMMTHLWYYTGSVDSSGKRLPLETEGPSMDGQGMAKYRDTLEIVNPDHWILHSECQSPDGQWNHFMTAHYRRKQLS